MIRVVSLFLGADLQDDGKHPPSPPPDESFPVGKANLAANWRPCVAGLFISISAKEDSNEAEKWRARAGSPNALKRGLFTDRHRRGRFAAKHWFYWFWPGARTG